MKIRELHIKNFKSIADITLIEPNPFTVFVGPNGAGKSNIFEALEYVAYSIKISDADRLFGGVETLSPLNLQENLLNGKSTDLYSFKFTLAENSFEIKHFFIPSTSENSFLKGKMRMHSGIFDDSSPANIIKDVDELLNGFSRIFINNRPNKINYEDDKKLNSHTISNLEKVLKRILTDDSKKNEFIEWMSLFIPEFENIDVYHDRISNNYHLNIKEKYTKKFLNKSLISDGTFNILCLLTAVYQSDEPQFLCIEEPENGLNPYVVKKLVNFFRTQCEEKGHYIWLNTHSQSLVSELKSDEIILVDKKEGTTQIKQIKDKDLHGLAMDEAWLSNALGGGLPW